MSDFDLEVRKLFDNIDGDTGEFNVLANTEIIQLLRIRTGANRAHNCRTFEVTIEDSIYKSNQIYMPR